MFRLVRYFVITSLIAFVIVTVILSVLYRQYHTADLITLGERNNVALTQAFVNSLWPQFAEWVREGSLTEEQIAELHAAVLAQMNGLSVVKVKLYNLDGLTVFSTEAAQIGQDRSQNAGFLSARSGQTISELTHRDTFSAFEGVIEDRNLISSYVPIRTASGDVEAVFEVYDDVTPLLSQIEQTQRTIAFSVIATLAGLYAVLFFIVRHADHEIVRERRERERAEAFTRSARDEAVEALAFKAQILANVSHEARTPLSVISLQTEMLQRTIFGPLTDRQKDALRTILNATRQLTLFINALLDEGELSTGNLKLREVTFQPADLLKHITDIMQPVAARKSLRFESMLGADMPETLTGDPDRLSHVIYNLVDNAIKFTEQGTVRLSMNRSDKNYWVIEVSDTGIGIPPDDQKRIFEAFWQVDGSTTRRVTHGVGLGLSIVKQITEKMGGQVIVTSEAGAGSTFTVVLPIAGS
jgi:two-component system, sensor histidine kinase